MFFGIYPFDGKLNRVSERQPRLLLLGPILLSAIPAARPKQSPKKLQIALHQASCGPFGALGCIHGGSIGLGIRVLAQSCSLLGYL